MKNLKHIAYLLLLSLGVFSCVDLDFDEPPSYEFPQLTANSELASLKGLYTFSGPVEITEDLIIEAVVVADDRSGNFYKNLIVEDGSAGINIRINMADLHQDFPIGRKIFIRAQGLFLGDYAGVIQLTRNDAGDGLESLDVDDHIVKSDLNQTVTPTVVTINQLNSSHISRLVTIEGVQFANSGETYADAVGLSTVNQDLEDCNGNIVIVRNSGYAEFAGEMLPEGNGSITAVYSVFNNDKQLFIRELTDVVMEGSRCGGGGTGELPTVNSDLATVKAMYNGSRVQITNEMVIEAIVTMDDESGNFYKELQIEDGTAGIEMKINDFDLFENFPVGTELVINCSGLYLDAYAELVQLGSVYTDNNGEQQFGGIEPSAIASHIFVKSSGATLPNTNIAIADLTTADIGKRITLSDVQFESADAGQSYANAASQQSLNRTIEDCNGNTIVLRSSGYASFAAINTPNGNGSITAVLQVFNTTLQLAIGSDSDANMTAARCDGSGGGGGGGGGGGTTTVSADFEDQTAYQPISMSGWMNSATTGTLAWEGGSFDDNVFAEMNPYNEGQDAIVSWLISPSIDLSTDLNLTFDAAMHHWTHAGLEVVISTDFDGSDITGATWTALPATLPTNNGETYGPWVNSGTIDLSSYSGTAYIAFKYTGDSNTNTGAFRIDNISVTEQ